MENLSRRGFVGTCCACSSVSFGWEIVRDSPMVNIVSQTMSKHNSLVWAYGKAGIRNSEFGIRNPELEPETETEPEPDPDPDPNPELKLRPG